ncbi:MAG TPA: hypothetical protein VGJ28_05410 [Micromonosporaceae bacterium]|jgi:uncharacterized protein YukE
MSELYSMDVTAVRNFANQLGNKADEIDSISNMLTQLLDGATWTGPDATQFRGDWNGTHRAQLHQVSTALRDASQRANVNVQQQVDASTH